MRPVGPDEKAITPRRLSVGDGLAPSADVRLLKGDAKRAPPLAGDVAARPRPGAAKAPANSQARTPAGPTGSPVAGAQGARAAADAALCSALRLPADAVSFATLSAMIGEGLPLEARAASSLRRAAHRHGDDPAAARVAAGALAGGLDPEDAGLERVLAVLDGDGPGWSDGEPSGGGERDDNGGDSGMPARDAAADSRAEAGSIARLAANLRDAASLAMRDPDVASLARRGEDGSAWVCVPFEIPFGGVNFHGFFRIWHYSGTMRKGRVAVDIRFDDERRLLELTNPEGGPRIAYFSDDEAERDSFLEEFGAGGLATASALASGYRGELEARRSVDEDA